MNVLCHVLTAVSYTHLDVYKRQIFDSVALKTKLPLDVISSILKMEPALKLPLLSDYTTFAFENKVFNQKGKEHARNVADYVDGVTYFITNNEQSLEPLLDLFTYLSKTEEESLHDIRAVSYTHLDVYKRQVYYVGCLTTAHV